MEVRTGTNRKRQMNLFDPDGTRVELMEPSHGRRHADAVVDGAAAADEVRLCRLPGSSGCTRRRPHAAMSTSASRPATTTSWPTTTSIIAYFQKLAHASDRILLSEFGKSAMGKPMYVAYISAPENLKKLDHYRDISRRLALGEPGRSRSAPPGGRRARSIVWIDSGLHASEVAPAQQAPELAYRMLTDESPDARPFAAT